MRVYENKRTKSMKFSEVLLELLRFFCVPVTRESWLETDGLAARGGVGLVRKVVAAKTDRRSRTVRLRLQRCENLPVDALTPSTTFES